MSLETEIRKIVSENGFVVGKVKMPKMKGGAKLKSNANFDFRLFDPEDSPGSDKANDEMNKEIVKASKMKDKKTAMAHMNKIQKKHSKHGATDTEPREVITQVLNRVFGEDVEFEENFIDEKLDDKDVPGVKKIINKLKGASKKHANQAKSLDKEIEDDVDEDIRKLDKRTRQALQHADRTAKPKSKVTLPAMPKLKEESLDKTLEDLFQEGQIGEFDHLDEKGKGLWYNINKKKKEGRPMRKPGEKGAPKPGDFERARGESVEEGYEGEVKKVLDKKGIDAYFKNGKLMVSKRDKPMVMKILKGKDFDMPKIQVEETQMENNRYGLSKSLVDTVSKIISGEAVSPAQQAAIAISKKEKGEKPKKGNEGNAFGKAVLAAKEKGEKDFIFSGKKYIVKDELDKVNPKAAAKKFDDRKDKDIDNDGDVDGSDKYLHKKRKAIGKAMKNGDGKKEPVDTKPKMSSEEKELDEKMTDAQMKKREEIVMSLKKKMPEFKDKYGDKAKDVMYATATKMAMKGK